MQSYTWKHQEPFLILNPPGTSCVMAGSPSLGLTFPFYKTWRIPLSSEELLPSRNLTMHMKGLEGIWREPGSDLPLLGAEWPMKARPLCQQTLPHQSKISQSKGSTLRGPGDLGIFLLLAHTRIGLMITL